jgi:predicted metal-binding protein
MSVVMIKCPQTGREVSTGIETQSETFDALLNVTAKMKCSACGGHHVWSRREAWLSNVGRTYTQG